jgi:hypothetical protein
MFKEIGIKIKEQYIARKVRYIRIESNWRKNGFGTIR